MCTSSPCFIFFFFNDTATTEIYTLSLHDALPILERRKRHAPRSGRALQHHDRNARSEEHTSELQSPDHLVCRLLLEKKKKTKQPRRGEDMCAGHAPTQLSRQSRTVQPTSPATTLH